MNLPNDPVILLSYINTQLRDFYPSLLEFCAASGADIDSIVSRLRTISYEYDAKRNQFV